MLREWRLKNRLKLRQVAKKLGTTIATASRIERGERNIMRKNMILKILHLTKGEVTPNDLFGVTPSLIEELKAPKKRKQKGRVDDTPREG